MKCRSRSTLGIGVGVFNILVYIWVFVYVVIKLIKINSLDIEEVIPSEVVEEIKDAIVYNNTILALILVVCFIMTNFSGLLIAGIVKRRHLLMAPWLGIAIISYVCYCIRFVVQFFDLTYSAKPPLHIFLIIILVAVLVIGLQGFILYKIYTLYKDIRDENIKNRSEKAISKGPISFNNAYTGQPPYLNLTNEKF